MVRDNRIATYVLTIDIGEIPIRVHTDSSEFAQMLEDRYGEFVTADAPHAVMDLEIKLVKEPAFGLRNSESLLRTPESMVRDSGLGKDKEPGSGIRDLGFGTNDDADADLSVRLEAGHWIMERGDFRAEWDPESNRGWVRQRPSPYAIDGVLRILHSLILARAGGFLVHAASAVRNGRAFVFAGVSGAGKTTLARLAPPDVTLLTDEISYVRETGHGIRDTGVRSQEARDTGYGIGETGKGIRDAGHGTREASPDFSPSLAPGARTSQSPIANYQSPINHESLTPNPESRSPYPVSRVPAFQAFGTPFAGELARIGQRIRAPLAALFLLAQGPENRIEMLSESQAVRELLRHVLFFARDEELVRMVFQTACSFVSRVPVRRLVFTKDARVWGMIGIDDCRLSIDD